MGRAACRIVAATNRSLENEMEAGRFRKDLYFRLATLTIEIPSLSDRRDEIADLAHFQLENLSRKHGKAVEGFSLRTILALEEWSWSGNVRELFSEIERAYHLAEPGALIDSKHLRPHLLSGIEEMSGGEKPGGKLEAAVARLERRLIERAVRETKGNLTHAAAALGISRAGLYRKMRALGIRNEG